MTTRQENLDYLQRVVVEIQGFIDQVEKEPPHKNEPRIEATAMNVIKIALNESDSSIADHVASLEIVKHQILLQTMPEVYWPTPKA